MAEVSTLEIKIKTDGADKATDDLEDIAKSAEKAEKASEKTAESFSELAKATKAMQESAQAVKDLTRITKELLDLAIAEGKAKDEAEKTNDELEQQAKIASKAGQAVENFKNKWQKFSQAINLNALKAGVAYFLTTADRMQALNNQIKFATSTTEEYIAVQERLYSIAQKTGASLEATTNLYSRANNALKDYGYSQQQILKFTENINKTMAVGGATAQEQASAMLQLSQALGAGKLQGNDYKSISQAAPILLDTLAQSMGKTRTELDELASKGEITAEKVFSAFSNAIPSIEEQFEQMPMTFGTAMTMLENAVLKFIDDFNNGLGGIGEMVGNAVAFIAQHLDSFAVAVGAALAIWTAFKVQLMLAEFSGLGAQIGMLKGAFLGLTTTMRTAWAVMISNPIGIAIASITALYLAWDNFFKDMTVQGSQFGATFGDVFGVVFDDIKSGISDLWNGFTSAFSGMGEHSEGVLATIGEYWAKAIGLWYDLTKGVINGVLGLFHFLIDEIDLVFKSFPGLINDSFRLAYNGVVDLTQSFINGVISILNKGIEKLNEFISIFGRVNKLKEVDFKDYKDNNGEQIQDFMNKSKDNWNEKVNTDYVKTALKPVTDYFSSAVQRADEKAKARQGGSGANLDVARQAVQRASGADVASGGKAGKNAKSGRASGTNARTGASRAMSQDYLKEWQNFVNGLENTKISAFEKIAIEQEKTLKEMTEKAKNAGVSFEEVEKAKTAIFEKYSAERKAIAEKYTPALKIKSELEEVLKEIKQAEDLGLLTTAQADKARDSARWSKGEQIAKQAEAEAVSGYDRWKGENDPIQKIHNEQAEQMAILESYRQQDLISLQDYLQQKTMLESEYTANLAQAHLEQYSGFTNAIDSVLSVMQGAGMQSKGIYRALFATSKASAIATSLLEIQKGIAQAIGLGFPQNIPVIAQVTAQGANVISQIRSTSLSGMAHSGIDYIPKEGTWLLDRGERVVDSRTNEDLKTFLSNQNANSQGNSKGGKQAVNVQIVNNGQPVQARVMSEEDSKGDLKLTIELMEQMDNIANARYQKNRMQEMRNGGNL